MQTLQIRLFGHLHVVPSNASAPLRLSRSAQALLAYLLLQQHLVSRDVLMDVFWMETAPEQARSNLTSAVHRLRQQLEVGWVTPGTYLISNRSGEVGFNWESEHWLDSEAFTEKVRPLLRKPIPELGEDDVCTLEAALTLYRGELLEGIYADWALREQEHYRSLYLTCLTRLMRYYAGRQEYAQSIHYGQELLRKEPLHEETHRELMRVYEANGQPGQALRQYEQLRGLLRRELDLPPLAETDALARLIRAGAQVRGESPSPAPAPEIARLLNELETVRQTIAELNRLLERISRAANALAAGGDNPVTER